ncbi:nucleotide exchange factor GrpE [Bacillus sp. AGMB 02131]|uniref:Protein GrpE n=1 Tax=Peribacillus faecalis TaxID=2772559 RepID=A0A927CXW2_9BACI|nr:nucleotide exchange factor GrpE [Peribacillus faecalis]MBD3109742.1 nucleotide exchange factor GrpE [Peribacillus faecalis]
MSEEMKKDLQAEESQADNETVEEIFEEKEDGQEKSSEQQLEEANAQIANLTAKVEEQENRYLRLMADYDNSRRRSKLDLEAAQKYRSQNLATDLIQAIDNFERALALPAENEETKSLRQGIEMVYKSLLEALKKEGVEQIESVGKEFDPNIHQAVMQVNDENFASNVVVEEFQKGYMIKDRVLRPAMVKVNQ